MKIFLQILQITLQTHCEAIKIVKQTQNNENLKKNLKYTYIQVVIK